MKKSLFCLIVVFISAVSAFASGSSVPDYEKAQSKWSMLSSGNGFRKFFFDGTNLFKLSESGAYNGECTMSRIKTIEFEGEDKNVNVKRTFTRDYGGSNYSLIELENGSFYLLFSYQSDDFELLHIPQMKNARQVDCSFSLYKMFFSFYIKDNRLYCATYNYEDKKIAVNTFPFFEKPVAFKVISSISSSMGYCIYESKAKYGIYFFTVGLKNMDIADSGLYFNELPEVRLSYGPEKLYSVAINGNDELYVFENEIAGIKNECVYRKKGVKKLSEFIEYEFFRSENKESLLVFKYENEDGIMCVDVSSRFKNYYHCENAGALSIYPNHGDLNLFDFNLQTGNTVKTEGFKGYSSENNFYVLNETDVLDTPLNKESKTVENAFLYKSYPSIIQIAGVFNEGGKLEKLLFSKECEGWYGEFSEDENLNRMLFEELSAAGKNSECIKVLSGRFFSIRNPETGYDTIYSIEGEHGFYYLKKYKLTGRVLYAYNNWFILTADDKGDFIAPAVLDLTCIEFQDQ